MEVMKKVKVFKWVIPLVVLLALLLAVPVLAMEEPTDVDISLPMVFQDLIVTNDFLVVAPYEVNFAGTQEEPINKTFLFKLIDTNGITELGSILAYPYYEGGYGPGVISFYFDEAPASGWEEPYIIRVEENPAYYPSPQTWSFPLSSADYTQIDGQDENRALLKSKILNICTDLDLVYTYALKAEEDTGTYLSSYGESYFRGAIRGLQNMCPELFVVQIRQADYAKRSWTTTFADSFKTQYAGTWVAEGMTGFSGIFDTETQTAWGFVILALCVVVLGLNYRSTKQIMPGFLDIFAVLIMGTLLGGFSFILLGLLTFGCVFVGGMVLFLNRA